MLTCYLMVKSIHAVHTSPAAANHPAGIEALPTEVQKLVTPELFAKYDEILLQRTLSTMSDVTLCPQCKLAVVVEPGGTLGVCEGCMFSFCVLCNKTWHGVSGCKVDDIIRLAKKYMKASPAAQKDLERRYGAKRIRDAVAELQTDKYLKKNSKKCPRCSTYISKKDGCNKMLCGHCHAPFCWLCLKPLDKSRPYDHYRTTATDLERGCMNKLFDGIVNEESTDDSDFEGDGDGNRYVRRYWPGEERNVCARGCPLSASYPLVSTFCLMHLRLAALLHCCVTLCVDADVRSMLVALY